MRCTIASGYLLTRSQSGCCYWDAKLLAGFSSLVSESRERDVRRSGLLVCALLQDGRCCCWLQLAVNCRDRLRPGLVLHHPVGADTALSIGRSLIYYISVAFVLHNTVTTIVFTLKPRCDLAITVEEAFIYAISKRRECGVQQPAQQMVHIPLLRSMCKVSISAHIHGPKRIQLQAFGSYHRIR